METKDVLFSRKIQKSLDHINILKHKSMTIKWVQKRHLIKLILFMKNVPVHNHYLYYYSYKAPKISISDF